MNTAPANNKAAQGFTLLELLLSMTLTVLLLGMLATGVHAVVNDWQADTGGLDDSIDEALALLQLERSLLAAYPHSWVHPQRLARMVYFHGEGDSLRYVSTISPGRQQGLTAWQIESDPVAGLLLRLAPAHADNPDARLEAADPVVLLPGYQARFRYLVERNVDERLWLDEWQGDAMQSLPLAVEVLLTPLPGRGRKPPLEVLAPIRAHRHENIEPTIPVL